MLLLLALAAASPPTPWQTAWDALLTDALGDPAHHARAALHQLAASDMAADDPTLPLVQYWLGQVAWRTGDVAMARDALDACIRAGIDKGRCLDLRSRIDLEVDAVSVIPTRWTFDDTAHGFLHPRAFWDRGAIRLVHSPEEGGFLAWTTQVDGARDDQLVVGFRDPHPTPTWLSLTARSVQLDASLTLTFEDQDGRIYVPAQRAWWLPRGESSTFTQRITDLVPITPGAPPASAASLHRLYVRDQTGLTGQIGPNVIHIDDFTVQ